MKAIRVASYGGVEVLKLADDLPKPAPREGQVLVKIHAAGLNFFDIYQRKGYFQTRLPFTPGLEASGVVESVGEKAAGFRPGDRVAYNGQPGSYGEYVAISEGKLIPLPDNMSFVDGAAFPLQALTAHYLLNEFRALKKGDVVLVHAAAGGVGLLAVQMAKRYGCTVIGTVSTEEKALAAREAGADHVILYTSQDFVAETKRITGGKGAQLILDGVGKTTFAGDLEAAEIRGTVVIFGASSGPADAIAPNSLQTRSITVAGGSLVNFTRTREELLHRAGEVLTAVRKGWLKLRIARVLPLAEAEEAHRLLEGRQVIGKIILKIAD
jgi:NADPH2:quinone reductase